MHKTYLLQSLSEFQIHTSPLSVASFVIIFVLLIVLFIYLNVSKRLKNNAAFNGKGLYIKLWEHVQVDADFYNELKYAGLTKKEASVLEKILKLNGEKPLAVLKNCDKVDEYFMQSYNNIMRDKNSDNIQQELLDLFSARQNIEYYYAVKKSGPKQVVARNFCRKALSVPCTIRLVIMKTTDGNLKGQKKLVLQNNVVYSGTFVNISQGGCAISSKHGLKAGSLIKLDFKIDGDPVAALGKILRLNKEGANWVYHIKFLKLSKKSIIALNVFIFDYPQAS
jgi:hypothetical protein